MTEGPIAKSILLFALPLIAANMMQQLYNTADSLIVGNFVGSAALAAVGAGGILLNLLMAFIWGASTGAGILIARYYGAKDKENLSRIVHTTMLIAVILGIAILLIGIFGCPLFLQWMNTPADMMEDAVIYLRLFFAGMLFNAIYNMAAGILNAVGNSSRSLMYLVISSITNIVLDLLFVAVFRWGIAGAAIATDISQMVSAILMLLYLFKVNDLYKMSWSKLRWDRMAAKQIVNTGFPTAVQNAVLVFSNILIQVGVNGFGTLAAAGFTAYLKIDGFNILPVMSFSLAATTFVGQNIGAGKMDRVKKGTRTVLGMCLIYSACLSVIMITLRQPIIRLFSDDPQVINYGLQCLWALAPFYVLLAVIHSLAGAIRGSGHTIPPMVIILIALCLYRIAWIMIAAPLIGTIMGVYLTYSTSFFVGAALMVIYTLRGKWLKPKMYGEKLQENG